MLKFPTKALKYIKKILLNQQREIEENLEEMEKDDPATQPSLVESSEPGTDSFIAEAHSKTLVLGDQLKKMSKSIKDALYRIAHGAYGKCENCGKRIELGRLLAMPTARYCLTCSKKISR